MKPLRPLYKVLYYIVLVIGQVFVRLVYPVRAVGRENLPREGGYILAPNHLFAIDPLYVLMGRGWKQKMLIMGKQELFEKNAFLNFIWAVFGAFPVDRGTGNKDVVEAAMREVRGGRSLLIFPEGTRSKDGELLRLKSGAFVIALESGAPMVPCRVVYAAGRPKPFHRITIVFGKPLTPAEMGLEGEYSAKKLRGAKELFAQKLEELYAQYNARL